MHELAATLWNHVALTGEEMDEYGIERPQMNGREAANGKRGVMARAFLQTKRLGSAVEVVAALWSQAVLMEAGGEVVQGPWPNLGPGEIADIMAYPRRHSKAAEVRAAAQPL